MDDQSFLFQAMIRGYHVYKEIWDAVKGECLECKRERSNRFDPFAVSVMKQGTIVGHLPRKISAVCSLFLLRNGTISCQVSGTRRYSSDIPQGGLEIPCILTFSGEPKLVIKTEKKPGVRLALIRKTVLMQHHLLRRLN